MQLKNDTFAITNFSFKGNYLLNNLAFKAMHEVREENAVEYLF